MTCKICKKYRKVFLLVVVFILYVIKFDSRANSQSLAASQAPYITLLPAPYEFTFSDFMSLAIFK